MKKIIQSLKNYPMMFCIIFNVVYFFMVVNIWNVTPENTDDHLIYLLLAGGKGEGTSDVIFINIILSKGLKFLCEKFPIINWFSAFEESIIIVSFSFFAYIIYDKTKSYMLAFMLIIIFAPYWYIALTFSSAAMIGGAAGGLFLLCYINRFKESKILIISSMFLILLSYMLREMAILGVVPFLGWQYLEYFADNKEKRKNIAKNTMICAIILGGGDFCCK